MAPLSNFEKAEKDRDFYISTLKFLESEISIIEAQEISEAEVDEYIRQTTKLWNDLHEIHRRLVGSTPIGIEFGPYELKHHEIISRTMKIKRFLLVKKSSFQSSIATMSTSQGSTTSRSFQSEVRLPKIELPKFKGDLTQWLSFRDLFSSSIKNNPNLMDSQKLSYLLSSVEGEALRLIQSISITDSNFLHAWDLLIERYENERELKFSILNRMLNQPPCTSDSAQSIRSLIDTYKDSIRTLETLGSPVDKWDEVLIFNLIQKLHPITRQNWELSLKSKRIPSLNEVILNLEQRASALSSSFVQASTNPKPPNFNASKAPYVKPNQPQRALSHHTQVNSTCAICSQAHFNFKCPQLQNMDITKRRETVNSKKLCFNCLRENHRASECKSERTCQKCYKKHHTMLHQEDRSQVTSTHAKSSNTSNSQQATSSNTASIAPPNQTYFSQNRDNNQTLLATALVSVQDAYGSPHLIRAFLDPGSTSSFINESCANKLKLRKSSTSIEVIGLGSNSVGHIKSMTQLTIKPHFHQDKEFKINVTAFIYPHVTRQMPSFEFATNEISHIESLQLADPNFNKKGEVDILIGGDVFWELLLDGKKSSSPNMPIAINSKLGWLIVGNLNTNQDHLSTYHVLSNLEQSLQKFWEIENIPNVTLLSKEEEACELHFKSTTTRNKEGIFYVELPFKSPSLPLGNSKEIAVRRLKSLEKRLEIIPEARKQYNDFMQEYLNLGHMKELKDLVQPKTCPYYIPHHFIAKNPERPEKFRVVFDASAKTTNGVSLNENLLVGPTIQRSLISILMSFRKHQIAFCADIEKMYRQIRVKEKDIDYQRIVWRFNPQEDIKEYQLLTVTYGTASAPFQAVRVLQQLAEEGEASHPLASHIMKNDFYVDDLMTGSSSLSSSIEIKDQILNLTKSANFTLSKWASNSQEFLSSLPSHLKASSSSLQIDEDEVTKTLGLIWNTTTDQFLFKVHLCPLKSNTTKRSLLSEISKIFDPLGWLSPTIVIGKILFQELWKLELEWDQVLPPQIISEWTQFRDRLPHIEEIRIPRFILSSNQATFELHGFSDASERAYAATVYIRSIEFENYKSHLVAAKTKVAPTKTLSIPRLELCGALLLAQLMKSIEESLQLEFKSFHAWTDSTVTLGWIQSQSTKWKTFVANRVSKIQTLYPTKIWSHVPGVENPADCASRGLSASDLVNFKLWWNGPDWLQSPHPFPNSASYIPISNEVNLEMKTSKIQANSTYVESFPQEIIAKFNSFQKLTRIIAWIFRFYNSCKKKKEESKLLTPNELNNVENILIKLVQQSSYEKEISLLMSRKPIFSTSKILSLNPFICSEGFLRVGGRLKNSQLPENKKFPILLPSQHKFTRLLIENQHKKNLHAGAQLLLTLLQEKFWIVGGRDCIRKIIRNCLVCARQNAKLHTQMMGNLPKLRITPSRPFLNTGVDYAGPFTLKPIGGRSKITFKGYICLLICFSTRAIHLELVSGLSTEAFMAALRRFISRRGKPSVLHSDCGTNFVGAASELQIISNVINSEEFNTQIATQLSNDGISWKFNPASAPHFGGLWESGVKSVKYHLRRVVGETILNYEEFTTVLTQIEALLNSRPLTQLSTDPNDLSALTPAHFLIGGPFNALPEGDLQEINIHRLNRWQLIQQMQQHFWNRWSSEYLSRLQQRPKWMKPTKSLEVGDLVLLKDDRYPPAQWPLGRIIKTHPGEDGLVRVVTIKTAKGEKQRPIVKLCLLPLDPEPNSNLEDSVDPN